MIETVPGICPLCGAGKPRVAIARGPDFEYRTTSFQEFTLVRCLGCDMVLLDPRPVDAAIARLYPSNYEPYRFKSLPALIRRGREIMQRSKVRVVGRYARPGATVVDVGCGAGDLLRLLSNALGRTLRLIGWDYPGPHLDALEGAGIEVIAAPIDETHVPRDVDLFVLNQVIEHFPDPGRVIAFLARALRPGGHILIETPDTRGLDALLFSSRYWGGYHIPRHMVLFNRDNLRRLVERSGLRVLETTSLASPAFWVQSLHHAISETAVAPFAKLFTLRNLPLVALATGFDLARAPFLPTSNQRLIAQQPLG